MNLKHIEKSKLYHLHFFLIYVNLCPYYYSNLNLQLNNLEKQDFDFTILTLIKKTQTLQTTYM